MLKARSDDFTLEAFEVQWNAQVSLHHVTPICFSPHRLH